MTPADFRAWLRRNQEARMQAGMVLKGDAFGGQTMRRRRYPDGTSRLEVGPDLPELPEDAHEVCADGT